MLELNVNLITQLIKEKTGKTVIVKKVRVANAGNQYNPEDYDVGIGGVLTLFCEEQEKQEKKNEKE